MQPSSQATPISLATVAPAAVVQWRRFVQAARRRWWIPLLTLVVALAAEATYLNYRTERHLAIGRVMVGGKVKIPEGGLYTEEWQNFFGTQIELMKSDTIRQRVLKRLQAEGQLRNESPVELQVSQMRRTTLFNLQLSADHPDFAKAYLEALMEEYLSYKREVRALSSDDTLASLTTQYLEREKDLKREQELLLSFQRTNSVPLLQEQASTPGLAKLNQQLGDLRLELEFLNASLKSPTAIEGPKATHPSEELLSSLGKPVADLTAKQELELLRHKREEWASFMRPEHPKMVKLTEEIGRLEKLVSVFTAQTKDQLEASRESVRLKIESLETTVRDREKKIADANVRLAEFATLKANAERVQTIYDRLTHVLQNVDLDKHVDQENLVVLDHATVVPRDLRLLHLALAGVVGLALGAGILFWLARSDDRLTSVKDLQQEFVEPVLGCVPQMNQGRKPQALDVLVANDKRHMFAEAYRSLRSSVLVLSKMDARPKSLMISSAVPHEGKSTVAVNLARALAFGGARVLLIDGDLRTGELHTLLGMASEPGLMQLPSQDSDLLSVVQPTAIPNLSFIPRGRMDHDPGELFLSPKIGELLVECYSKFDYMIFDSAPICAAADSTSLAPKLDGVLFVMREGYTSAKLAKESLSALKRVRVNVVGLVINQVKARSGDYPYYKYPAYAVTAKGAA